MNVKNKNLKCSIDKCERLSYCKTFCSKHYYRYFTTGNPLKSPSGREKGKNNKYKYKCSINKCNKLSVCKTFCDMHYWRYKKTGDPLKTPTGREHGKRSICIIDGCNYIVESRGYCKKHYLHWKRHGDPLIKKIKKRIGLRITGKQVQFYDPTNHLARPSDGYVPLHRYIMEKKLGRELKPTEVVNHIDRNPLNNSEDNLELFKNNGKHIKNHMKDFKRNQKGVFIKSVKSYE